jgi:uncharacterized protein YjiS (DUF1127 family)
MTSHHASPVAASARIRWPNSVRVTSRFIPATIGTLIALVGREVRIRRDRRLLGELTEHELADIGVTRDAIGFAVRTGRLASVRMDHL